MVIKNNCAFILQISNKNNSFSLSKSHNIAMTKDTGLM